MEGPLVHCMHTIHSIISKIIQCWSLTILENSENREDGRSIYHEMHVVGEYGALCLERNRGGTEVNGNRSFSA